MPTYVSLVNWTTEGIKEYRDTVERASQFTALVQQSGGTVKELLWTVGDHDLVAVTEFSDAEAAVAVLLQVGALGKIRTTTLTAFTAEEMTRIIGRTG